MHNARLLPTLIALCFLACSSSPKPTSKRPSLLSGLASAPAYESPAHWDYHPQEPPKLSQEYRLESGARLLLAEGGERWLVEPGSEFAQVSANIAPEALLAAIHLGADGWVFVGESGATYETRSPLGPFLRTTSPPDALVRVAVTRRLLLAVTRSGELMRSEDLGATWTEESLDGRAVDVALLESGEGLLLMVPERLRVTKDFGVSWQAVDTPRFGAVRLAADGDRIHVLSVLESRAYYPKAAQPWKSLAPKQRPLELGAELPLRARADAMAEGMAVVLGENYYEVRRRELLFGALGEPLRLTKPKELEGCFQVRLAGGSDTLYLACATERAEVANTVLFRSVDGAKTWQREPYRVRAKSKQLQLAVVEGGGLVISGICSPERSERGCAPYGVYYRTPKTSSPESSSPAGEEQSQSDAGAGASDASVVLQPATVPALRELPLGLAASVDGKSVYILGSRTKGDSLVVFFSHDAGKSFDSTEVSGLDVIVREFRSDREVLRVESLAAGEDGYVSAVLFDRSSEERILLVLDREGEVSSLNPARDPSAFLGGVGLFALRYSHKTREVWESLDGGDSWESIGSAPVELCANKPSRECLPQLACHPKGCFFGSELTRVGWRGQVETDSVPPAVRFSLGALPEVRVRTPVSCRFLPDKPWQSLPASTMPTASQAALGETAWYSYGVDTNNVSVYSAPLKRDAAVDTTQLFPKLGARERAQLHATLQIEGVAALRAVGGRAEVGWSNFIEKKRQHATLPSDFYSDYRLKVNGTEPSLVSIASGGLFARATDDGPTYFVDGSRTEKLPAIPASDVTGRSEMVRADGQSLAVRLVGGGAGIVRARLKDSRWASDAATVGLIDPTPFALRQRFDIAYLAEQSGFHLMHFSRTGAKAWWFPFSAGTDVFGPAIGVPNQSDLSDPPRPCNVDERRSTPRLVSLPELSTRHPVVLTDSSEPIGTMLTNEAVLYGTPQRPCAAVFEASPVVRTSGDRVQALVSLESRLPSWLFRQSASAGFEYRPMECQFDPQLPIPSDVYKGLETP